MEHDEPPIIFDPTSLTRDSGLTAEQKRLLQPPEILTPVTEHDGAWLVLLKLWDGRMIWLAAKNRQRLRHVLLYFSTLDREVVYRLLPQSPVGGEGPKPEPKVKAAKPAKITKTSKPTPQPKPSFSLAERIRSNREAKTVDRTGGK